MADKVFEVTGRNPLLDIALELERIALEDEYFVKRKLYPNVDFYSGLIYQAMGFPVDMFPVLFAIPRTVGWLAQWEEMLTDKEQKIARPRQVYLGADRRDYVPVDKRVASTRVPRPLRGVAGREPRRAAPAPGDEPPAAQLPDALWPYLAAGGRRAGDDRAGRHRLHAAALRCTIPGRTAWWRWSRGVSCCAVLLRLRGRATKRRCCGDARGEPWLLDAASHRPRRAPPCRAGLSWGLGGLSGTQWPAR
jgi:hypothetical protein